MRYHVVFVHLLHLTFQMDQTLLLHYLLHDRLWENGRYLKQGLKELGFNIGESETPITPCIIGDEVLTQEFSKRLNEEGVYAKSILFLLLQLGTR